MFALALLAASAAPSGEVLTYIRSDTDGAMAERIVIYDRAPGEVWVHKSRSPCTNAAFVKGRLDPASGQALALVGGRLTRSLEQEAFAWLAREPDGIIRARLGSPHAPPAFALPVGKRWVLYDFDFGDVVAHPPAEIGARRDLSFDFPLLLTGEDGPSFRNLGRLDLNYAGSGEHEGAAFHHYRAGGPALGDATGQFWFGTDGRLLDAVMPIPNHAEHRDLRLRLVARDRGEAAWTALLARHWEGCPPP
jgi:hypothetical protein